MLKDNCGLSGVCVMVVFLLFCVWYCEVVCLLCLYEVLLVAFFVASEALIKW